MGYIDIEFERKIEVALEKVKEILDSSKHPNLANNVPHYYDDKFFLAEFLTNIATASIVTVLSSIGMKSQDMETMFGWSRNSQSVSIRFEAVEQCHFLKSIERKKKGETKLKRTVQKNGEKFSTMKQQVITEECEYLWVLDFEYRIVAYPAAYQKEQCLVLTQHKGTSEISSLSKEFPHKEAWVLPAIDLNISWVFQQLNDHLQFQFAIDRSHLNCHTPYRNQNVASAIHFFDEFLIWCNHVNLYFRTILFPKQTGHSLDLASINSNGIFVFVLPFFEENSGVVEKNSSSSGADTAAEAPTPTTSGSITSATFSVPSVSPPIVLVNGKSEVLPLSYIGPFFQEQQRSFEEKIFTLKNIFPSDQNIISFPSVKICVSVLYGIDVCKCYHSSLHFIETMLRDQLVKSIGKVITPSDFSGYMRYHYQKLYHSDFSPTPFCYPIRRIDHSPEGLSFPHVVVLLRCVWINTRFWCRKLLSTFTSNVFCCS